jgi:hypothetical protein
MMVRKPYFRLVETTSALQQALCVIERRALSATGEVVSGGDLNLQVNLRNFYHY